MRLLGSPRRPETVPDRAPPDREDDLAVLHAVVAEAVIVQDAATELLARVRDRQPLAELAPPGGELASRFLALKRRLPASRDAEVQRHVSILNGIFDHHAMMLATSLDLLAVDWRSERIVEQLETIDGLGAPAERLESIRAELKATVGAREL
jgi:hypothetical protein